MREFPTEPLWVLPGASAVAALLLGFAVARLDVGPDSVLAPLALQGTADDARALVIDIAVQAVDHRPVIFCAMAVRPLGEEVVWDPAGTAVVIAAARRFGDYPATRCWLIRRYGSSEPTLTSALLPLLANCVAVLPDDADRWAALDEQADLVDPATVPQLALYLAPAAADVRTQAENLAADRDRDAESRSAAAATMAAVPAPTTEPIATSPG